MRIVASRYPLPRWQWQITRYHGIPAIGARWLWRNLFSLSSLQPLHCTGRLLNKGVASQGGLCVADAWKRATSSKHARGLDALRPRSRACPCGGCAGAVKSLTTIPVVATVRAWLKTLNGLCVYMQFVPAEISMCTCAFLEVY